MAGLLVKLQGCELNHQMAELAIDVMGEYGMLYEDSPFARDKGMWQTHYMFDLGMIIGGGSAQIQKNIISERGLGMPGVSRNLPPARLRRIRAATMYFGLSEDQLMLQDSVGRYLEGASELEEVRKFVDGEGALAETLHKGLEELGVPFVWLPEAQGGLAWGCWKRR